MPQTSQLWLRPSGVQFVEGTFCQEAIELAALFSILYKVYIPDEGVDRRVWEGSVDGSFSVDSFFSAFVGASSVSFPFEGI